MPRKTVTINLAAPAAVAAASAPVPTPATLRRVEAGLYETPDGRYGVIRAEGYGEFDEVHGEGWAIVEGSAKDGHELPGIYPTKRAAAEALAVLLANSAE